MRHVCSSAHRLTHVEVRDPISRLLKGIWPYVCFLWVSAHIHLELKFRGRYFSAHISEVFLMKVSSSPAIYLRVYGRYHTLIQGFTLQWNSSIFTSVSTLTPHPPLLWPRCVKLFQMVFCRGFWLVWSCFQCRYTAVFTLISCLRRGAESGKNKSFIPFADIFHCWKEWNSFTEFRVSSQRTLTFLTLLVCA